MKITFPVILAISATFIFQGCDDKLTCSPTAACNGIALDDVANDIGTTPDQRNDIDYEFEVLIPEVNRRCASERAKWYCEYVDFPERLDG